MSTSPASCVFYLYCFRVAFFAFFHRANKNSSGDEIANVNFYAVRPGSYLIR